MDNTIPFEVTYAKAKSELISCVGYISQKYDLPMSMINMMIHEIDLEAHNQAYSIIFSTCDITINNEKSDIDPGLKDYLNTVNTEETPSPSEEQQ